MSFRRGLARPWVVLSSTLLAVAALGASPQALHASSPPSPGLWGWGYDALGQLGPQGTSTVTTPAMVPGIPATPVAVAGGQNTTLFVEPDGTAWGLGDDLKGELGDGQSNTQTSTPVQASGLTGVTAVSSGNLHSLALLQDGTVRSFGWNSDGELGDGTFNDSSVPVQVSGLSGITAVVAAQNHSLALRGSDGSVWAWGTGYCGELGNGLNTGSNVPVQVPGLSGVVAIAGGYDDAFALKSDGTVWAWGGDCYGTAPDSAFPVQLSITGVVAIGDQLALRSDGTVWMLWSTSSSVPTKVAGLAKVVKIASGPANWLAMEADGSVWTWGSNQFGQDGNGTIDYMNGVTPVQATGFTGATDIAAGGAHILAIVAPVTPPTAPLSLTTHAASKAISLSWQAPSSAGSNPLAWYLVYRGTSPGTETLLAQVPASTTAYTDTQVKASGRYYYQVSAVSVAEGARSAEVCGSLHTHGGGAC